MAYEEIQVSIVKSVHILCEFSNWFVFEYCSSEMEFASMIELGTILPPLMKRTSDAATYLSPNILTTRFARRASLSNHEVPIPL